MTSPVLPSVSDRRALQRKAVSLVHPRGSRGKVCLAAATPGVGKGWNEGLVAPSSRALSQHIAVADFAYQGMLRFSGHRDARHVVGISSAFQDLDYYKDGLPHASASAEDVAGILLEAYEAAGIPRPSYIQDSGQGAYAVWLFAGMTGKALPRWQRAMRNLRGPKLDKAGNAPATRGTPDPKEVAFEERMLPLRRTLKDLGLDRGAFDAARVLKVMGTVHPDTGRMARLAWPSSFDDIEHVSFDVWCDALMPYTRAELASLRAEREAWKAANPDHVKAPQPKRKRPPGGKWALILSDLMRLLEHRGAQWFADNRRRDLWAYYAATAISVTQGGNAEAWAERLAPLIGLPIHELTVALSGVERGMLAHQAGDTVPWNDGTRPAFYDTSIARVVDEMDVGIEEAGDLGLRILVPGGAIPLTAAERQRLSRDARNPNRATRDRQATARLQDGYVALGAREEGYTVAEVAYVTGRSEESVRRAMKEAEAAIASGEVVESPSVEVSTPDDLSRSIVAESSIEAPAALPAPSAGVQIPEGEVMVRRFTPFLSEYRTATERWTITRAQIFGRHGGWTEIRDDLSLDGPELAPAYVSRWTQASLDARTVPSTGAIGQKARRVHGALRGAPRRRSAISGATAPMAPLDVAHEAALYLAATRGS
ncbi:hypothetical protein ASF24_15605 [Methylobacterium sp. Leaf86]|uniref:hypothetical protein n=1 Tax=Methylobacterium sp. Leaf86 TaxID=1736242 RepID=UPI0006F63B60|nr:hypothetical protein [Methylobacterium sp. Leaf86]KQO58065.1 hypothetical protein ASF24_15605 [Methylobacterium sp. Leaf86]